MNITVLAGPNGSGKTTLMSFITNIFHHVGREHDKIPCDFELCYDLFDAASGQTLPILLFKKDDRLYITVEGNGPRCILPSRIGKRNLLKIQKSESATVEFSEIERYLPKNVIVSAFSVHGEYPTKRPSTFIGKALVKDYAISNIYGKHHYHIGTLSPGLVRLAELSMSGASREIDTLRRLLGIDFTHHVKVRPKVDLSAQSIDIFEYYSDIDPPSSPASSDKRKLTREEREVAKTMPWLAEPFANVWRPITNDIIQAAKAGKLYINDIQLRRHGVSLSLGSMSAGEKVFFVRLLSILSEITDNSIVILEEPELHLDPSWTKQIVTVLHAFFARYRAHFLVATHTFSFINAVFPENILLLKQGVPSTPNFKTFLANEPEISTQLYESSADPNLLEDMIYERLRRADASTLRELMQQLGESHIKLEVFRRILDMERKGR